MLLLVVTCNFVLYYIGLGLSSARTHYDFTTALDRAIPFLPWTAAIYWGCFAFWGVNYTLGMRGEDSEGRRFLLAHFLGEAVCLVIFVLLPTVMERPTVTGSSLPELIIRLTYYCDQPNNLFPSIHCYASWLCWVGVRKRRDIPGWYRWLSLLFALSVCVSTLTVKQHVIVDVPAGILTAELGYFLAGQIVKPGGNG